MASGQSSLPTTTRAATATNTKHKICLQWATSAIPNASASNAASKEAQSVDRHSSRKVVDVGPTMIMEELGTMARNFFLAGAATNNDTDGSNDNNSSNDEYSSPDTPGQKLQLSIGYPTFKILEWEGNHELVRDCLAPMDKVECTLVVDHDTVKQKGEAANSKQNKPKKRKPAAAEFAKNEIVDLTSDAEQDDEPVSERPNKAVKSTDGDEALARRLQKEELAHASSIGRQQQIPPPMEHSGFAASNRSNGKSNAYSSILEDPRDPTTVTTPSDWIYQRGPSPYRDEPVLGKWLVFRKETQIDATWSKIAKAVKSGHLVAASSKVATRYNFLNSPFVNSKSYVICVYTSAARMDQAGLALIQMVRHDLHYKTDEATAMGHYSNTTTARISKKTMYWNNGRPSTTKTLAKMITATASRRLAEKADSRTKGDEPFEGRVLTVVGLQHGAHNVRGSSNGGTEGISSVLVEGETAVILTREPSNAYDTNAIRVEIEIDAKKEKGKAPIEEPRLKRTQIGYVDKKQAQVWTPWLDRGLLRIEKATVFMNAVDGYCLTVVLQGQACPQAKDMLACF